MTILFIDFASHSQIYALIADAKVLAVQPIDDHKAEADLLPSLRDLLINQKMTLQDLNGIACAIGPGGFTSLRVGVAMANALSYSLKIPSAGIHLSDLWAEAAKPEKDFVWVHSTRKSSLFVRGFGKYKQAWPEPIVLSTEELLSKLGSNVLGTGELIPEHAAVLAPKLTFKLSTYTDTLPQALADLEYTENQTLLPWYGRDA